MEKEEGGGGSGGGWKNGIAFCNVKTDVRVSELSLLSWLERMY